MRNLLKYYGNILCNINYNICLFCVFQLYSAGNETDRRSFLDSLFSFMQEQGKCKIKRYIFYNLKFSV